MEVFYTVKLEGRVDCRARARPASVIRPVPSLSKSVAVVPPRCSYPVAFKRREQLRQTNYQRRNRILRPLFQKGKSKKAKVKREKDNN